MTMQINLLPSLSQKKSLEGLCGKLPSATASIVIPSSVKECSYNVFASQSCHRCFLQQTTEDVRCETRGSRLTQLCLWPVTCSYGCPGMCHNKKKYGKSLRFVDEPVLEKHPGFRFGIPGGEMPGRPVWESGELPLNCLHRHLTDTSFVFWGCRSHVFSSLNALSDIECVIRTACTHDRLVW